MDSEIKMEREGGGGSTFSFCAKCSSNVLTFGFSGEMWRQVRDSYTLVPEALRNGNQITDKIEKRGAFPNSESLPFYCIHTTCLEDSFNPSTNSTITNRSIRLDVGI